MPEEEAECRSKINPLLIGRIAYLHSARAAVYLLLNRIGGGGEHVIEHAARISRKNSRKTSKERRRRGKIEIIIIVIIIFVREDQFRSVESVAF